MVDEMKGKKGGRTGFGIEKAMERVDTRGHFTTKAVMLV